MEIFTKKKGQVLELNITKFDVIIKIIQMFKEAPILGIKQLDFNDFCKVADQILEKKHLTQEGLDSIFKIKSQMNKGRII
jgi:hypothetical protein